MIFQHLNTKAHFSLDESLQDVGSSTNWVGVCVFEVFSNYQSDKEA